MSYTFTAEAIVHFAAAFIALVLAVMGWRRRGIPGGREFCLLLCAAFVWSLGSAMESAAVGVERKVIFNSVCWVGSVTVSPLFFLFAMRYRARSWKPTWWQMAGLWLIPVVSLSFVVTNRWHGLIWSSFTPSPVPGSNIMIYGHGPWYYVSIGYFAVLGIAAAFILGRSALQAQRMFRRQTAILITGLLLPWIGMVVYLLPCNPWPGLYLPPIGFVFSGLLIMVGMRRFHLLDIVPVARHLLVESMADGIMVVDGRGRIVDVNPVARAFLGSAEEVVGRRLGDVQSPLAAALGRMREQGIERQEMPLPGDPARYSYVRVLPLAEKDGSPRGTLLVIHDLTERRHLELEREKLITELQDALADVKALSGLLPICASCKKVRDDKGYWRNLERYVTDHSAAQFSHSLCPECARRLYPDLVDDQSSPASSS